MPNVTDNLLSVSGAPVGLAAFVRRVRTSLGELDFRAFVAAAADDDGWDDAGQADDEDLPTAQEAWGTKWNATNTQLVGDPASGLVHYFFETAWNAPLPWLVATALASPDLTFELLYVEPAMGFAGLVTYAGAVKTRSLETHDPSTIAHYGDRRFDLLRIALEDPAAIPHPADRTPEEQQARAVLWDPSFVRGLLEAADRARSARPTARDEARYLALADAYEVNDGGAFAATALRAAGHENEAVARFAMHAELCEDRGRLSESALALLNAGLVEQSRAMMRRAIDKSLLPPFTI